VRAVTAKPERRAGNRAARDHFLRRAAVFVRRAVVLRAVREADFLAAFLRAPRLAAPERPREVAADLPRRAVFVTRLAAPPARLVRAARVAFFFAVLREREAARDRALFRALALRRGVEAAGVGAGAGCSAGRALVSFCSVVAGVSAAGGLGGVSAAASRLCATGVVSCLRFILCNLPCSGVSPRVILLLMRARPLLPPTLSINDRERIARDRCRFPAPARARGRARRG